MLGNLKDNIKAIGGIVLNNITLVNELLSQEGIYYVIF